MIFYFINIHHPLYGLHNSSRKETSEGIEVIPIVCQPSVMDLDGRQNLGAAKASSVSLFLWLLTTNREKKKMRRNEITILLTTNNICLKY